MADETGTTTKATADATEFGSVLIDLDRGKVHDDATQRLADLIEAVARTGDKGKLTLVVEVEPQDPKTFADTGVLLISGTVTVKLPVPTRAPSIFYANGLRSITRDDPHRDDPFGDKS